MSRVTNTHNISLGLAVWLVSDDYDYIDDESYISVTGLLEPTRKIILTSRLDQSEASQDLVDLFDSRVGQALHKGIESTWQTQYVPALEKLGYPKKVIDRIRINPETEEEGTIPVYMEQRAIREIDGVRLGGKYDFVFDGQVQDFKKTKVFKYLKPESSANWIMQGSIYRWLNPEKITNDELVIQYLLLDWNRASSKCDPNYPSSPAPTRHFKLLSLSETESWIKQKLSQLKLYKDAPEEQIPECPDEALWRNPPKYSYYSDPTKTDRATKNFDNEAEAHLHMASKGKGIVRVRPGLVRACNYCPAQKICSQYQRMFANGEIAI